MLDRFQLDPYTVLGVSRDADASAIRAAFHRQSKKHHPDLGGDDWAFRIVVRAYEELIAKPAPTPVFEPRRPDLVPEEPEEPAEPFHDWSAEAERVRKGLHDKGLPPSRMVLAEVLWCRVEVEDLQALIDRREVSHLSGSLHLTWPDPEAELPDPIDPVELHEILSHLTELFDGLRDRRGLRNARSHAERGRFKAWLGFDSGQDAWSAFKAVLPRLRERGLGVRQLTRELTVPKDAVEPRADTKANGARRSAHP